MKRIPGSFLEDIVKVFLLGIDKELRDPEGDPIPNLIRHLHDDFEYVVDWSTLIELRKDVVRILKSRKSKKLDLLALAIEMLHEDD